jgi:hypothetical protein
MRLHNGSTEAYSQRADNAWTYLNKIYAPMNTLQMRINGLPFTMTRTDSYVSTSEIVNGSTTLKSE